MADEGDETGWKSFLCLLLGYFIIAPTNVYGVVAELGSFATGETLSAAAVSVLAFFNMIGFVVVVYSHILYLNETENLLFEKEVAGNSLKFLLGLLSVSVLTLVYINAVLVSYDFYRVNDPELGYVEIPLTVFLFIYIGILIFNILFVLVGPVYILLFYLLVVRG